MSDPSPRPAAPPAPADVPPVPSAIPEVDAAPAAEPDDPAARRLIAAQRREFVHRRRWLLGTRLTGLSFAAWYLTLITVLGREAPFYQLLNVFAVITAVSAIVVVNYFDPPLLLRNLHDPAHPERAANWRAFTAMRATLLPTIVQDLGVPEGPERARLVHRADADELVQRTAGMMRRNHRRFGRIYLAVYLVVASAFIAAVILYDPTPR